MLEVGPNPRRLTRHVHDANATRRAERVDVSALEHRVVNEDERGGVEAQSAREFEDRLAFANVPRCAD